MTQAPILFTFLRPKSSQFIDSRSWSYEAHPQSADLMLSFYHLCLLDNTPGISSITIWIRGVKMMGSLSDTIFILDFLILNLLDFAIWMLCCPSRERTFVRVIEPLAHPFFLLWHELLHTTVEQLDCTFVLLAIMWFLLLSLLMHQLLIRMIRGCNTRFHDL